MILCLIIGIISSSYPVRDCVFPIRPAGRNLRTIVLQYFLMTSGQSCRISAVYYICCRDVSMIDLWIELLSANTFMSVSLFARYFVKMSCACEV